MSKFFIGDIKCDKDGGVGCEVLGRGFLVSPVRPDSSEMIFTTGCNGGSAESCLGVGRLLTERTNRSLFHLSTAAGFFAQGCTLGSRAACTAGRVLRSNAAFGVLDLRKARTLFEREGGQVGAVECAAYGADACYNLGLAYELPEFGTPDRTRAKAFMAGACTAKFAKGCADLGRIEQQAGRNAPALAAYELGCTYGDRPGSCNSAAELRRYLAEVEQITRRNAQICAASRRNPC